MHRVTYAKLINVIGASRRIMLIDRKITPVAIGTVRMVASRTRVYTSMQDNNIDRLAHMHRVIMSDILRHSLGRRPLVSRTKNPLAISINAYRWVHQRINGRNVASAKTCEIVAHSAPACTYFRTRTCNDGMKERASNRSSTWITEVYTRTFR